MPEPVRQSIIFSVKAPAEATGLSAIVAQLAEVEAHINRIQKVASKGLFNLGGGSLDLNKSQIEAQITAIAKTAGLKGKVALEDVFKGMKLDPGLSGRLLAEANKISETLKNAYKFSTATMSWGSAPSPATMAATVQKIFASATQSHANDLKALLTPAVGKIEARAISASVDGAIKLIIPATQIQAVLEGSIQVTGTGGTAAAAAGAGRGKNKKPSAKSVFSTEMSGIELDLAETLKAAPGIEKVIAAYRNTAEKIRNLASGETGGKVGGSTVNRALIRATKLEHLAGTTESETADASIREVEKRMAAIRDGAAKAEAAQKKKSTTRDGSPMGTYSYGSDEGHIASRQGEADAQIAEIKKRVEMEQKLEKMRAESDAKFQVSGAGQTQEQVNRNYQKRLQQISAEESAIIHRYNVEKERMAILEGPHKKIAQSQQLYQMSGDYARLSKAFGVPAADRIGYQQKSELLAARAEAMQIEAKRDPSHRGGSRWLNTGLKGWSPEGLAKNILTVTGWTAAVSAMYAPIELARYSLQRMIDIGLQTQRLSQVFKGVGGNAQELTADVLHLAVATGQSTEAAMEAAIGWSRFGLSRKQVVEATRVSLMAANTANIAPEVATERMSAIYSDYGLNVNQLSGALGMLEHTANTAKVSVKDLMDAVMISGSAARQSGMSFSVFQGIVGATVSRTSQTGNRIGTAVKSVLGTLYNPEKQELLRMRYGVEVRDDKGNMKPANQLFQDMYVAYNKMDDDKKKTFSYAVGDKQQANRFIAMMNSFAQAETLAYTAQTNLNTAEEANSRIMESQHAQLVALRSEWDKFIVTTGNARGGSGLFTGLIGGLVGAGGGFLHSGLSGAIAGGAKGFGFGALAGSASSLNESMVDMERLGQNLLALATNPMVSGTLSGAFTGRFAGRALGGALLPRFGMVRQAAGFAGMTEAELAAGASRFGGVAGIAVGAGIGLVNGMAPPGPRNLTAFERAARGDESAWSNLAGSQAWSATKFFAHPIRNFNALTSMFSGDGYGQFSDERQQDIEKQSQAAEAYRRSGSFIKSTSGLLTASGVSAGEKEQAVGSIAGMLGDHATPALRLTRAGDYVGAQSELAKAANEKLTAARDAALRSEGAQQADMDLGNKQIADLRAKQTPENSSETAKQIAEINDRIVASQEHLNQLKAQENELDIESADNLSLKSRTMIAAYTGIAKLKQQLAEQAPGFDAEDRLERENKLLKEQAALYLELSEKFAQVNAPLAAEYLKKNLDARAQMAFNSDPAALAAKQKLDARELALNRYGQASQNSAVGFTEAEKQINRARYDFSTGKSTTDEDQRYAAEKDYHETRIGLVTRYNQLLSEQKQLQMDIAREYGKSLLFGDPGDLLTKLSALKFRQKGQAAGDWFAMSGNVRQEADMLAGGEQGRTNRRERQKILEYFGGKIPTLPQEQVDMNTRYFPAVPKTPADTRTPRQKEMDDYYEKAGYGKYHWSHAGPTAATAAGTAAGTHAAAILESTKLATSLNSATTQLGAFERAITKIIHVVMGPVQGTPRPASGGMTLPGTLATAHNAIK